MPQLAAQRNAGEVERPPIVVQIEPARIEVIGKRRSSVFETLADWLPRLFPHKDMRPFFVDKPALIEATAFRNSSLQGGYLMLAARALGLDCGPMSGFDSQAADKAFFPEGDVKSNFICALGHGDPTGLYPRSPRPEFDDVCRVA